MAIRDVKSLEFLGGSIAFLGLYHVLFHKSLGTGIWKAGSRLKFFSKFWAGVGEKSTQRFYLMIGIGLIIVGALIFFGIFSF